MRDNPLPVILILLILAALTYYFYQSTGGDLDAAVRMITSPGGSGGNPIDSVTDSVSNLGKGIGDAFSGMLK